MTYGEEERVHGPRSEPLDEFRVIRLWAVEARGARGGAAVPWGSPLSVRRPRQASPSEIAAPMSGRHATMEYGNLEFAARA